MPKKLMLQEFLEKVKASSKHKDKHYNYSRVIYLGGHTKVEIICRKHGSFWQTPNSHVNVGQGCPECAGSLRLTNKTVDNKIIGRNIKRVGEVIGRHTKILWKCLIDEYEWSTSPGNIIGGSGCPKCAGLTPLTNELVDKRINDRPILRLEDVKGNKTKILWLCLNEHCGYKWHSAPKDILVSGAGCPCCAKYGFNPEKLSVVYLYTINDKFCGYGITNDMKTRNKTHQNNFKKCGARSKLIATFECVGYEAKRIEKSLKKNFEVVDTGITGFKKEATHLHNLKSVLQFINSQLTGSN